MAASAPGLPATVAALRARKRLGRRRPCPGVPRSSPGCAWEAVARTLRLLPTDSRCLMRSLVLSALLARRGIDSSLVIGVRTAEAFGAHAWVEHEGRPLLPTGASASGAAPFHRLVEV